MIEHDQSIDQVENSSWDGIVPYVNLLTSYVVRHTFDLLTVRLPFMSLY